MLGQRNPVILGRESSLKNEVRIAILPLFCPSDPDEDGEVRLVCAASHNDGRPLPGDAALLLIPDRPWQKRER